MELNIIGLIVLGVVVAASVLSVVMRLTKITQYSVDRTADVFLKVGWLLPFIISASFFGAWIVDILIPTLKGANFNELYDLHGIRYLDITLVSFVVGFVWCAFINCRFLFSIGLDCQNPGNISK